MNVRNDVVINSPNNKNETCTEFVIDDITKPFMLNGTTEVGEDYTFSAWIKSSEESSINIYGESIPITNEWKRKRVTFNATGLGIRIYFDKVGTYYFYKSQLELGKVMSDASPSPEDIKASLEVKINRENLISEINASADVIRLTGDRLIIDSTNLQVTEDGTITAKNGKFTGIIEATEGNIAGFNISKDGLVYGSVETGVFTQISGDEIRWIAGVEEEVLHEISGRVEVYRENRWFQFYSAYKANGEEEFTITPVGGFDPIGIFKGEGSLDWVINPPEYLLTWDGIAKFKELTVNGKAVAFSDHTHNKLYNAALGEEISFIKDGNYGYFRPNTASLVYCGSSSRPWYKVFTERLEVTASRPIFQPTYDNTTTYATNCYIGSTGILSRTTTTSSKTIKHDIKELQEDGELSAKKLYNIGVRQFKYNDGVITDTEDARYGKDLVGFIIEELDEIYPIAVDKPSDNVKEWSWNAQYLIPPMLQLIQEQKQEIEDLKTKMNKILNALEEMGVSV